MAINQLQLPSYAAPQSLDFSPLANLGKVYQQAQQDALRKQTLADLGNGAGPLDYAEASRKMLAAGDTQAAFTLANLGNQADERNYQHSRDARDFGFREQEAQRAQGNTDRAFTLQQSTANPAETKTIKDANGNETLVRIDRQGNGKVIDTGVDNTPTNPYSNGKMNENQSKDSLYATRMFEAEKVFRQPGVEEAGTSYKDKALSSIPVLGNSMVSNNYQKYDQAQRNFINATLRRESGAAIAPSEFDNANKQYFPQRGDGPDVIAQKRQNRLDAARGFASGAGPSYTPPYIIGPNGELTPTPPKAAKAKAAAVPTGAITKEAFDALPSGTPFTAPDGSQRIKP
jgi:hypothetical protein